MLGLVFIKYISETFNELYEKLEADEYSDTEDRDEYLAKNVFFVPAIAHWTHIYNNSKLPSIGETIDEAMEAIEKQKQLYYLLKIIYALPMIKQMIYLLKN